MKKMGVKIIKLLRYKLFLLFSLFNSNYILITSRFLHENFFTLVKFFYFVLLPF